MASRAPLSRGCRVFSETVAPVRGSPGRRQRWCAPRPGWEPDWSRPHPPRRAASPASSPPRQHPVRRHRTSAHTNGTTTHGRRSSQRQPRCFARRSGRAGTAPPTAGSGRGRQGLLGPHSPRLPAQTRNQDHRPRTRRPTRGTGSGAGAGAGTCERTLHAAGSGVVQARETGRSPRRRGVDDRVARRHSLPGATFHAGPQLAGGRISRRASRPAPTSEISPVTWVIPLGAHMSVA